MDFIAAPAFIKTIWIAVSFAAGAGATASMAVRIRIRQLASSVRGRHEERMAERERIARELHDTLLQSIEGLVLMIQVAAERLSPGEPARLMLEQALEHAGKVIAEGRDRIQDLRTPADAGSDLAHSLATVGALLARGFPIEFRICALGDVRSIKPSALCEIYAIGREALLNAFRHAHASSIEVEVVYSEECLCIRIRDDGLGIDASILESRPGHWGVKGMRERAMQLKAQLSISSKSGTGTQIELRVPASCAYEDSIRSPRWKHRWLVTPFRNRVHQSWRCT